MTGVNVVVLRGEVSASGQGRVLARTTGQPLWKRLMRGADSRRTRRRDHRGRRFYLAASVLQIMCVMFTNAWGAYGKRAEVLDAEFLAA